jgi:hypothetical protein
MSSSSHGLTEEEHETLGEKWWKLYYHNGVYMGDVIMNDDGYYVFVTDKAKNGYWTEGNFLELYTYLKAKNKDWDESVNDFFR